MAVNDKVNIDIKDNTIIYELFVEYIDDGIIKAMVLDDETIGKEILKLSSFIF